MSPKILHLDFLRKFQGETRHAKPNGAIPEELSMRASGKKETYLESYFARRGKIPCVPLKYHETSF